MKRLSLLASFVVSTFCATETFSQTKFHLELGGGYASNTLSTGVLSNWEGGWSINLAALCDLATCLQLTARTSYHHLSYTGDNLQFATPDVAGFRREVDGDNTNVYEFSFGARLVDDKSMNFFFAARSGMLWMDVGRIRITQGMEQTPDNRHTLDYPNSGVWRRKGFASFNAGFIVPVSNVVNLVLESSLLSTFDREEVIIPLTASVQIGL